MNFLPANPPRPLTPIARRLIWSEPRVRRWWLLSAVVFLLFAAFVADRLWARHTESQLIQSGEVVPAKIVAGTNKINGQPVSSIDLVRLEVNWPDHQEELSGVYLTNGGVVGQNVSLHIDKNDHTRWTDRTEPTPLLDSLFVGLLALPVLPVLIFSAFAQRRRLENIWQNGVVAPAVVFDRRHSPIAPTSYAVQCSLQNRADKKLFTLYVPGTGRGLNKGDQIWVVLPPKKGKPLAALWMASAWSQPA